MEQIIPFLIDNWILLTLVVVLLIYRRQLIFDPLAGGNGKIQMDELAKGVIVGAFIYAVYKEGERNDLSQVVFNDTFYAILLAGVFAIAAIKPVTEIFKHEPKHE